ncbi:MAG: imidazole glycerol phosphate synthase subunit HisH [Flavobacteriaceae bacterium]
MSLNSKVTIIDYGAGNIQSLLFAFERLGTQAVLSSDPETISNSDHVVFPGVGAAGAAMKKLKQTGLNTLIPELKQPVLGICLGMQLMCEFSEEQNTEGLNIFDSKVQKFDSSLKIPCIGWNTVTFESEGLYKGISSGAYMYFVHSYFVPLQNASSGITNYGLDYSASLEKDNFFGVQFHPEKSALEGSQILSNFLKL